MCKWETSAIIYDEDGNMFWDDVSVETESMDINEMKEKALANPWVKQLGTEAWVLTPDGKQRYVLF
jgi:hypothetical protein